MKKLGQQADKSENRFFLDGIHFFELTFYKRLLALAVTGGIVSAMSLSAAENGEFKPDQSTLLLAHFNETAKEADYALGWSNFAGSGATLTEGYYGKALDSRSRPAMDDFTSKCDDYTPLALGWGFYPKGNVDFRQGTFECWTKVSAPGKNQAGMWGGFLNGVLGRSALDKSGKQYNNILLDFSTDYMRYVLPTVSGKYFSGAINFKKVKGFEHRISENDWHHFALTWGQGEMAMWLDGRLIETWDMKEMLGLVIASTPARYVKMSGAVIDELRISNAVRYQSQFDPNWRDGKRPAYAFTGNPEVKQRYPQELITMPEPKQLKAADTQSPKSLETSIGNFVSDEKKGFLASFDGKGKGNMNGLMLWDGLERKELLPQKADEWKAASGKLSFTQLFDSGINVYQSINSIPGNAAEWIVEIRNTRNTEAKIEIEMSIPVPFEAVSFFDGAEIKDKLSLPRYRDCYFTTLPYVAASSVSGDYVGVGLDPQTAYNDIVNVWLPPQSNPVIRQGTKIAFSPGEKLKLRYVLVKGQGRFGTLDAVEKYHQLFPRLYTILKDLPIYSYLPVTQHDISTSDYDMKRQGYAANSWGHGPSHAKGFEFGDEKYWNTQKFNGDKSHEYAANIEKVWGSLEGLRRCIKNEYKNTYENFYFVRRFHCAPDLTAKWIIDEVWPECGAPNNDVELFGQYYFQITGWYFVNEYNTPLGKLFIDNAEKYFDHGMKKWSPGFINDVGPVGAYRHNDLIARKTPYRSFSRDLGTFVRGAMGRQQRYEAINNMDARGKKASIWSDGGAFSYTLNAYSSAIAIEGAEQYEGLTACSGYIPHARMLLGEKPFASMISLTHETTCNFIGEKQLSPALLRDLYRYNDIQLMLFCLKNGVTLDPSGYLRGRQEMLELNPLLVDCSVKGRKMTPGAEVNKPLWVVRAGDGLESVIVAGNEKPEKTVSPVKIINSYFNGSPIIGRYFGGNLEFKSEKGETLIKEMDFSPRSIEAFKVLAMAGPEDSFQAETGIKGDGITLDYEIKTDSSGELKLQLNPFAPIYEIKSVTVNGKEAGTAASLSLAPGKHAVKVICKNKFLDFSAAQFARLDLIKDNKTNFRIIADKGQAFSVAVRKYRPGFERGTAAFLEYFVKQYDQEDGILGNLETPAIASEYAPGYAGWTVELQESKNFKTAAVKIDDTKRIVTVGGPTQGAMREALVVFLRLLDRKYPHVGKLFPYEVAAAIKYDCKTGVPFKKLERMGKFFEKYEQDKLFLAKPLLRKEYESIYEKNNVDFAGKYKMRFPPFIVEPTCGDDFVYGFNGTGKAVIE